MKKPPRHPALRRILAGVLLLIAPRIAEAALSIVNGDIVANNYTYRLSFSDLGSATKFDADVYSRSNVSVFQDGSGTAQRNYVRATAGQSSASLVYRFDFSATDYAPTSLAVTDYLLVNTPAGTLTGTTEYSVNGTTWTLVRTKSSTGTAQTSGPGVTTIDFTTLPQLPEVVYYRTTFTISGATFPASGAQWARSAPADTGNFTANFTVANVGPGPSSGALNVSANGHYLVDAGNNPVFLVGDTLWMGPRKLSRSDVTSYLNTRQSQNFNMIWIAGYFAGGTEGVNAQGDHPFQFKTAPNGTTCYNVTQPITTTGSNPANATEYDYWDHFDYIIQEAKNRNIYVGVVPTWGALTMTPSNMQIPNGADAYAYGRWLGNRLRNFDNILYVIGGDINPTVAAQTTVWDKLAEGLADGTNNVNSNDGSADYSTTLMTYHEQKKGWGLPIVYDSSATWYHTRAWLDFNGTQEHPEAAAQCILFDFNRTGPVRPTFLNEGRYEAYVTSGNPVWDHWTARFQAYQGVFSGGFGHMYGHEVIWDLNSTWPTDINAAGAADMQHLRALMQSLSATEYLSRVPAQSLIASSIGSAPPGDIITVGCDRITATKADNNNLAMVYVANGRNVALNMDQLAAGTMNATWFNPRDGTSQAGPSGVASGSGAADYTFDPPGSPTSGSSNGNDWVLVLRSGSGGGGTALFEAESLAQASASDSISNNPDTAASGGAWEQLNADAVNDQITYTVPVAAAGTYTIKVRMKKNPNRGIAQLAVDGANQGSAFDQYSAATAWSEVGLGTKSLSAGNHAFKFTVTGKHASSTAFLLSIDCITLEP